MSRGGSAAKRKGSSFERDVAQKLSELTGESFIRAPGSGAYVGGKNSHRKEFLHEGQIRTFKGDVVPGPSYSNWNIECKSYSDFPFHHLLSDSRIPTLEKWIDQMLSVEDEGDVNLLFMKFNRKGIFVLNECDYWETGGCTYTCDRDRIWSFDAYEKWMSVATDRIE